MAAEVPVWRHGLDRQPDTRQDIRGRKPAGTLEFDRLGTDFLQALAKCPQDFQGTFQILGTAAAETEIDEIVQAQKLRREIALVRHHAADQAGDNQTAVGQQRPGGRAIASAQRSQKPPRCP